VLSKSGAWYAYREERIGQGREHAKRYLKEHPEVATAVEQQLRRELGLLRPAEAEESSQEGPAGR
jgi:recombination protein RecA